MYYGVGDFEIFVEATATTISLLTIGNYVTRLNDDEIGIIEKIEITRDAQNGLMVLASGRFAKILLERRIIYTISGNQNKATILTGNVESAARALVANNATACTFNSDRNIGILELGAHSGSTQIIVDKNGHATRKQVTNKNLLSYTDALLQEYFMSAKIIFSEDDSKLQYTVFSGVDRSADNSANVDAVIFSTDFDNLTESDYSDDISSLRNAALIGGEGEGLDRFYSTVEDTSATGIERREIFVDASDTQRKYEDENETEQEYTDAEYSAILESRGDLELAQYIQIKSFSGSISTNAGMWIYGIDYGLGDIVTVQDNTIGVYANVRITETTEVQDDNGYSVELKYE